MSEEVKAPNPSEPKDYNEVIRKMEQEHAEATGKEIVDVYYNEDEYKEISSYLAFGEDYYVFYTPKVKNIPQDKLPIFKIKAYNSELEDEITNFIFSNNIPIANGNDLIIQSRINPKLRDFLIKKTLVAWKNYRDIKGNEIKMVVDKNGEIENELLKKMPLNLKMDLAEYAFLSRVLDEKEALSLEF